MKRKLPSAIRPMSDDEAPAVARLAAQHEAPVVAADTSKNRSAAPGSSGLAEAATRTKPAHGTAMPLAARAGSDVEARHAQALGMVQRYAAFSAGGGAIPLPIANLASITALNVHMVKRLCDLYGVEYQRDRARALVVGLLGGIMPSGLGMITASTLGVLIPASGLIGLAVNSVSALACTRSIGNGLVEHFESGKTLHELPLIRWT